MASHFLILVKVSDWAPWASRQRAKPIASRDKVVPEKIDLYHLSSIVAIRCGADLWKPAIPYLAISLLKKQ